MNTSFLAIEIFNLYQEKALEKKNGYKIIATNDIMIAPHELGYITMKTYIFWLLDVDGLSSYEWLFGGKELRTNEVK